MSWIAKIIEKTSGWKSIISWLILKISEVILTYYPDFPAQSFIEFVQWLANILLAVFLGAQFHKNVTQGTKRTK